VSLASPSLSAVKPTLTGSITFMRDDNQGSPQTWVACADLTQQRQITSIAGHASGWPVWSPDGSRIAIDTDREDPNTADAVAINDVFTMAADGSDVRKLTDSVGVSGDPAWSPDGSLIAFEADRGSPGMQGIYVAEAADGSGLRRITTLPSGYSMDKAPRFSPDGEKIVFTREASDSASSLYVVGLDGSGLRSITSSDLHPGDATWSPDGSEIAFEADLTFDGRPGPWIVESDGQNARSLTGPQDMSADWTGFSDPVWSPDGTLIMMLQGVHKSDGTFLSGGLATIKPDGTGLNYVADGSGVEHQPDWSAASC
jgi:TolB protein